MCHFHLLDLVRSWFTYGEVYQEFCQKMKQVVYKEFAKRWSKKCAKGFAESWTK